MKEYTKPILEEVNVEIEDICAGSGLNATLPGDNEGLFDWKK